ncbi:MAG: SDR family NAD(P)-dependent oxidoreductase [Dehalococcoidales bacterium]|nr:SDR family NAD(P)-dependent oxidoreductase [Dehalococcoidales bacterium]
MSIFELKGKVAIVTGGGTGIGAAIAIEYAKVGAKVVVASRKVENLEKTVNTIKKMGGEAMALQMDVRVPEQVTAVVQQTVNQYGKLDIMVNNAGAGFPVKIEELSPNGWDVIMNIDLKGVFLGSQAAAKVMIPQKSGKIVNIASVAGLNGSPSMAHYGAAKAGVINLTRSCAGEWAKYNINVNCIAPGMIETEGVRAQQILTAPKPGEITEVPHLQKAGKVEDVAYLALFLASAASEHISGETYAIRGVQR